MKTRGREWHELTGAYAVDALDGPERQAFEHHLARCGSCDSEVRGLRETAARLGMAAAVRPPEGLQDQVLAATYSTRQLPPPPASKADPASRRLPRPIKLPRLTAAVAALSVAAAAALGITQAVTSQRLGAVQARNSAITAILAAPDARITTTRTAAGATMTVISSVSRHESIITTTGMPAPPAGKAYQAWVMTASGATSAGLLQQADGHTSPVLADRTRPGDKIGITIEPAGGTTRPTTTPLVTLTLPA